MDAFSRYIKRAERFRNKMAVAEFNEQLKKMKADRGKEAEKETLQQVSLPLSPSLSFPPSLSPSLPPRCAPIAQLEGGWGNGSKGWDNGSTVSSRR